MQGNRFTAILQENDGTFLTLTSTEDEIINSDGPFNFVNRDNAPLFSELIFGSEGIVAGVETYLKPQESSLKYPGFYANSVSKQPLEFRAFESDISFLMDSFESNLVKIVNHDIFLTTIPLKYSKSATKSFISLFKDKGSTLIGITIDSVQKAVFTCRSSKDSEILGFIDRISKYWQLKYEERNFPLDHVYLINFEPSPQLLKFKPITIDFSGLNDLEFNEIRVLGILLTAFLNSGPVLVKETERAKKRTLRFVLNITSLVIVLLMLLVVAGSFITKNYSHNYLKNIENEYKKQIASDVEINDMLNKNRDLAKTILNLEKKVTYNTSWAKFLYLLGKEKPSTLFIERLGSEPIKGSSRDVRIALQGFSAKETSITELISILQKTKYISKVSLVTMEKDKNRKDKYRFKILCTLLSKK